MYAEEVKNLIRSFFGKRFSKETQLRFWYWLRLEDECDVKDEILRKLWESSPSDITKNTWTKLSDVQKKIVANEKNTLRNLWVGCVDKYAAAVAIWVLIVFSIYYFTRQFVEPKYSRLSEFYVPYGEQQQLNLPDGSTVWLNAGSILIYPSEFVSDSRMVYLSGEACFEVAKNPDKPFIVSTQHLDVQALGTLFSIKAYPGTTETRTTLKSGSIKVDMKSTKLPISVLKPNEQLTYSNITHTVTIDKVDTRHISAWRDGYLIFKNARFGEVVDALERKYNVTINYNAEKYNGCTYYVKFNPDENIEDALLILKYLISDFRYQITGKIITIN